MKHPVERPLGRPSAALCLALLGATVLPAGPAGAVPRDGGADESGIVYIGRWRDDRGTAVANWPGAYLKTDFTGTTVKARLRDPADIYVSIDGRRDVRFARARGTVNLTRRPLPEGVHSLRIAFSSGNATFQGLELDPGARTRAPHVSPAGLEFIGDSITAGETDSRAALSAYGWLVGERLHAEHTQIARSGACLVAVDGCPALERLFFRAAPATGSPPWEFDHYRPDVVVVNLGTNDAHHKVRAEVLRDHYIDFLGALRECYPDAAILVLQILRIDRYTAATRDAVAAVREDGDHGVFYVPTRGWLRESDYARDGIHPNDAGQARFADRLAPVVRRHLPGNDDGHGPGPGPGQGPGAGAGQRSRSTTTGA